MERREFLLGIAAVALGAAAGCGGGSSTSPGPPGFDVESSFVDAHTHVVRIGDAELADPPAAGVTYTTTTVGHAHTLTLTQAELRAIQAGQTVVAVSSVVLAHQHAFAVRRP